MMNESSNNDILGKLLSLQNGKCTYCKKNFGMFRKPTIFYKDGNSNNNNLDNLVAICLPCDISRTEWLHRREVRKKVRPVTN